MAQYSVSRKDHFNAANNDLHEVMMLSRDRQGTIVDSDNPLPVSIGGESVTITGPVTIPGEVEVSNDEGDPLHVDIVGQTFSLLLDSANHINVDVLNSVILDMLLHLFGGGCRESDASPHSVLGRP